MLPLVLQIERTGEHVADTMAFAKSPVRIGRNPLNDLPLEEGFVSQWHAVVRFNDQRTTILDLGSTNRTTVDGVAIERNVEVPVDESSDIRIGSLRLHVLRVAAPSELFGRRRSRSAFARVGSPEHGDVMRTMFLGDLTPSGGSPVPSLSDFATPSAQPAATPSASAQPSKPAAAAPARVPSAAPRGAGAGPAGDLQETYRAYRNAWGAFFVGVRARLETLPKDKREAELLELQRAYPQLALEPDLQSYLKEIGIDPLKAGQPQMEDWLRRLTDGLFPPRGGVPVNIALAMERVGEILEVFAQAFIELRRAQDQFCREMSLARYAESSVLQHSDDPHAVLAYLLTPTQQGADRPNELARALADHALHQVALVSAVVEGGRAMLENLSPKVVRATPDPPAAARALPDEGVLQKMWPHEARKLWRRFSALHHDLADSDRFTRDLFGRAFARRYYSMTGGGSSE